MCVTLNSCWFLWRVERTQPCLLDPSALAATGAQFWGLQCRGFGFRVLRHIITVVIVLIVAVLPSYLVLWLL